MTKKSWHRQALQEEASRKDREINLAKAALLIAAEEYPEIDIRRYLERLDEAAERVHSIAKPEADCFEMLGAINYVLFNQMGLAGNRNHYYNPENSYLNRVMDVGIGIPITLSIIYMEVAWRLGFSLRGVGLPGHFIVKHVSQQEGEIFIDPFNEGAILSVEECEERVRQSGAGESVFQPHFLGAVTKRQILIRLLNNLKNIYLQGQDYQRALRSIQTLLTICPWNLDEIRDRGLVFYQLQQYDYALADLETYLRFSQDAADAPRINVAMEFLRALRESANP